MTGQAKNWLPLLLESLLGEVEGGEGGGGRETSIEHKKALY